MKETCYPRDTVILLLLRVYSVAGTFLIVPDYCPALLEQQPAKVRDWALLSATAPCAQIAPCSGVPLIRIAMHKAATFDSFADDPSDLYTGRLFVPDRFRCRAFSGRGRNANALVCSVSALM